MEQIILPLHLLVLAYTAWYILHADHMAFNWIRGKVQTLDPKKIAIYHKHTWIGLVGMIATGFMLFWPLREFLLTRPQFYIKMAFVLALVINGVVIGKLQTTAIRKPYKELTAQERIPLLISGAVSTFSWIGAAIMAFFLLPF